MASNTSSQGGFQTDSDVHISYADQQKINRFARLNAKMEDLKDELKVRKNELQNLDDACTELELYDDDEQVPYHAGEVFIIQDLQTTLSSLAEAKKSKRDEIGTLEEKIENLKSTMSDLKAKLYAKFGNHINLEAEED